MGSDSVEIEINSDPCMWREYLISDMKNAEWIAPVNYFKHAPFSSNWDKIAIRHLDIECINPFQPTSTPMNWLAKVICFAGYKAMILYYPMIPTPRDPQPKSVYTWIPFCSDVPKPLGYSTANEILLYPPLPIGHTFLDAETIMKVTKETFQEISSKEGKPVSTVPSNFEELIKDELKRCASRFVMNEIVEAVNRKNCGTYRLARVVAMVGDRIRIIYWGGDRNDDFWFNHNSTDIHKLGWCQTVGATLTGINLHKLVFPALTKTEAINELPAVPPGIKVEADMLFMMRHPVLTHKLCFGYVSQVLQHGYFLAATDWTRKEEMSEKVLHVTSDYILPLNFCHKHRIPFDIPLDAFKNSSKRSKPDADASTIPDSVEDVKKFSWKEYKDKNNYSELDLTAIHKGPNPFVKGCKLEAIEVTCPVNLRPATVTQVAGKLLKIHFDGFPREEEKSYQWVSCDSSNIYPVGYAEMVWHGFKGTPDQPSKLDLYEVCSNRK